MVYLRIFLRMRITILLAIICFGICIFMFMGISCLKNNYYSFTADDGIVKYSFECPDVYENLFIDKSAVDVGRGRLSAALYQQNGVVSEAGFGIYTHLHETTTNMSTLVERQISYQNSLTTLKDFTVLNRSEIIVDNVKGEKVSYLQTYEPDLLRGELITEKVTYIYFKYEDILFNLVFGAIEDQSAEREAEFDHIIKTFKILE